MKAALPHHLTFGMQQPLDAEIQENYTQSQEEEKVMK